MAKRESLLMVFIKAPRPGAVKTRLARDIGAEAACWAYVSMVRHLWRHLEGLTPVRLCHTPDDAGNEMEAWLKPGWSLQAQGEGDLGRRLRRAFASAFEEGFQRVAVIGSDCPQVTREDVEAAWEALARHDLVIGPATDGGYWLLGLRREQPDLFEGIDWSTERVLDQTLARARAAGLDTCLLRTLADVDSVEDWRRFLTGAALGAGCVTPKVAVDVRRRIDRCKVR